MKAFNLGWVILGVGFFFSACQSTSSWNVVREAESFSGIEWSAEEQAKDYVIRHLKVTDQTSHHIVRLKTAEKPHYHDRHDLTVFVLKGRARVHFKDRHQDVEVGDVVEIPRGTYHWAQNLNSEPGEVYVIFNPPFDGKDIRLAP